MLGMAAAANAAGHDAVAMNFRGCSGEPNRLLRSYHGGDSGDVAAVVEHLLTSHGYRRLGLVGFSLGGNMMLNYLGDGRHPLPAALRATVGICVPLDLEACADRLDARAPTFYGQRFLKLLMAKARIKARQFPDQLDPSQFGGLRTFLDFDGRYTAPVHGFADARSYWRQASALRLLHAVRLPTLVLNAQDDPLLAPSCFPAEQARDSQHLYLELPQHGGHVGFLAGICPPGRWQEQRALAFLSPLISS